MDNYYVVTCVMTHKEPLGLGHNVGQVFSYTMYVVQLNTSSLRYTALGDKIEGKSRLNAPRAHSYSSAPL